MALTVPPVRLIPDPHLLIGAERVTDSAGGLHEHVYPASGKTTRAVLLAGPAEIDRAVATARQALPGWRALPANERRDALLRLADLVLADGEELADLQSLEIGLPKQLSDRMPMLAADHLRYHAGWLDKVGGHVVTTWPVRAFDFTLDEPFGVVAVIIPWNGVLVALGQLLGPALAAGNTVVLKPPEQAAFVALRFGDLLTEAGIPAGVVNIVPGGPAAGEALVAHPGIDKVHFTGSAPTGRRILELAARNLTPVALELGGKSAHVIFPDADLRLTARLAMTGAVALSGQGCANGTRVLVHSSVHDEVLATLTARLRKVPVGDPFDARTVMGPVVSEHACDRVSALIARSRDSGAGTLSFGGVRLGGDLADGYFLEPTVFTDVDPDSELAQEEIFGPVLSVFRFDSEEQAIELANRTRYGLAAYLHTNDLRRAHRVSAALKAGTVWVNGAPGLLTSAPFGGVRGSGYGRVGGWAGVSEFLRPKNVWMAV